MCCKQTQLESRASLRREVPCAVERVSCAIERVP